MTRRVGFLGTGWIGRHRMEAMIATGAITPAAICDPDPACRDNALALAPDAQVVPDLQTMLALDLDGIVIATPSALHAEQSIAALDAGAAVFCQKPLGRTAVEVRAVIAAARAADRLLGVDLSYRYTQATAAIRTSIESGALGRLFAIDLTFHNAYGPDKPWFYDATLSGGGCLIDLGTHLADLALWLLGFPQVSQVRSRLYVAGEPAQSGAVEDYAIGQFDAGGVAVRIACSWRLHAGQDAVIAATLHGTGGGAALTNVDGSFYDFRAERFDGTTRTTLSEPPDAWGGRGAAHWAVQLAQSNRFDAQAEDYLKSAELIDHLYRR